MPADDSDILLSAGIDLQDFSAGLKDMLGGLDKIDAEVTRVQRSMSNFTDIDVDVIANTSRLTNADTEIKALSQEVEATVKTDTSDVVTADKEVKALAQTPNVDISVDDDKVGGASDAIKKLTSTQTVTVDANTQRIETAIGQVASEIGRLKQLAVLDLAANIPGLVGGAVSGVAGAIGNAPGVQVIGDQQQASALLTAQSGQLNPEELALATELYRDNLTESIAEGAVLLNQLKSYGVESENLRQVSLSAFDAQAAFAAMGDDAGILEVALAQNQLVINGLARDFDEAADLIAQAELSGVNRAGDLLDVVTEVSDSFQDVNFTGAETFNALKLLMDAGVANADFASDSIREFGIRLGTAASDAESAEAKALQSLGLENPVATGEAVGYDFFVGVLQGIQNAPAAERAGLLTALIGTQTEDFGSAFEEVNLEVDNVFNNIGGKALGVRTLLSDNIGQAFTSLFREINLAAADVLSSKAIDVPGKIEDIKNLAQTFADEIQGGATIGEAAEVTLNLEEGSLARLESILGNIGIAILQGFAGVLDLINQGAAADALRKSIEGIAEGQLAFDIKLAKDGEGVQEAVQNAISRGVDGAQIGAAVTTSIQEQLAAGNVGGALESVRAIQDLTTSPLTINGIEFEPGTDREDIINRLRENYFAGGAPIDAAAVDREIQAQQALQAFDITALSEQATAAAQAAEQAFIASFNSGDLAGALDIADALNDPALLDTVFRRAQELNFQDVAQQAIDKLAQEGVDTSQYQPIVDAAVAELQAQYDAAIEAGDFSFARIIAEQGLNDQSQIDKANELESQLTGTATNIDTSFSTTATNTQTAMTDATTAVNTFATDSAASLEGVNAAASGTQSVITTATDGIETDLLENTAAFSVWSQSVIPYVDAVVERIIYGRDVLAGMNAELGVNGQPTGASTPQTTDKPAALGGEREGLFWTGERGPELVSTDERVAVLNNPASIAFMNALASVRGYGAGSFSRPSGTTSNRNSTLNQTNIIQNNAQAVNIPQKTIELINGY